ncbi:Sensory/regulatory protein RpfC [Brevundimonas subvibrioides]
MTPAETHQIEVAMLSRSRQWTVRIGMAVVIGAVFCNVSSVTFSVVWLATYALTQLVESQMGPKGTLAAWLGAETYPPVCLALVFINNVIFGLGGAMPMLSGTTMGLICGPLLLGGAFLNAVMVSPGSRQMTFSAALPPVLYLTLVPVGAIAHGFGPMDAFQITLAALLLPAAGLATWMKLSTTVLALERAQTDAEDANRAKSDFLATMSHEIRTPLNGVLGMAQAMTADRLSVRQRQRLDIVTQSGQALLTILSDVLDLAKIEARKVELETADFDLETLVEQSRETFRAVADAKGLSFETRVEPAAAGTWRGDTTRLRQILSNLISNAIKFTDAGTISVVADAVDGRLRVTVEDTGVGVTAEQLPLLFGKFVQADASTTRKHGGTGLGLSICMELAHLMGGSIEAERIEPHGLRFTFEAPLERVDAPRHPVGNPGDVPARDHRALRVLAAEDHPVNRQVLSVLLGQAGIIPHIVENGAEAVAAWRRGAADGLWDLILMDVQMPVMDGPTAARAIRAEEADMGRPPVPIIALTANVMTHQVEAYRQAGMNISVAKPIEMARLLAAMEAVLPTSEETRTDALADLAA